MPKRSYDLLSLSILILSIGVSSSLVALGFLRLIEIAPLVTVIMGLWLLALSVIHRSEEGNLPFGTLFWGLILVAGGVMGFLYLRDIYKAFFIPAILIVLGLIGILATLLSRR